MKSMRLMAAAAVAVSVLAVAPAASADENCVGAEPTFVLCVEPTGDTIFSTCVYTGGDTCTPVAVPGPLVTRCSTVEDPDPKALIPLLLQAVCEAIV